MRVVISIFLGFYLLNNTVICQQQNSDSVKIKIENGLIEGIRDAKTNLNLFFGIPFAKPPVGDLRWKAPQPMENWNGVLKTKEFSASPAQIPVWGELNTRSEKMAEDCLYLNIWTPSLTDPNGLPVLVYFYGGGFVAGDGAEPRYDGASMAQKGIVAVTINYRLNIFGFFSHPELSAESPYKASGNYGLLDQNAALKWVKRNISAFGGDPDKITIAGESAGSVSVSAHMASPLSRELIAGAIGESGAATKPNRAPTQLEEAEKIGLDFAIQAGYPTLSDLRALSTNELLIIYENSNRFGFPVTKDGYFYPKTLTEIFEAGEQAQIPLLVGWNSAEIPGYAFTEGPYTDENYSQKVKEIFPNDFDEVMRLYPHETVNDIELSATALASDRFIAYHTWKWFDLHRKNSSQPVYRYLFDHQKPLLDENTSSAQKPIGAAHAEEIEYCMGNLYLAPEFDWNEDDYKVSKTMLNYFANFIITGNPNEKDLPDWPAVNSNDPTPPVMIIKTDSKAIKAKNDVRYLFLDRVYAKN